MKFNRKYFVWFVISASIFVISLTLILINAFTNFMSSDLLKIIFIVVAFLSAISTAVSASILSSRLNMFASILRQNLYNFNERSGFFDLDAFIRRVEFLRRMPWKRKKQQFVIIFTASNEQISLNLKRNESVIELNKNISKGLESTLNIRGVGAIRRNNVFGFAKGLFYLCTFGHDENGVKKLIDVITNYIYDVQSKGDYRFFIQPMYGVAQYGEKESITEVIDNAIIARNLSEKNFEQVTFYHESFRKAFDATGTKEIEDALQNNEFVVYYQPKFSLVEHKFTSSEALVRWNSPKYGLLPPARFIPLAEASGLIHTIDTFVFKRVLEDISNTIRRGHRVMPVSVNFSLYEFFSTKFLDSILAMLDEYKIDPSLIQIEITETTSQTNQFLSITIIKKLQEKGIKILMDDFGVGFSNIGNLRKIPFDCIKIDKSFIDTIDTDPKSAEIVKFLIQLCKINGMEVIAEGVDNAKQVELLKRYKCDTIQGWYYSKAISYADFEAFLANNRFEAKEKEAKK